MQNLQTSHYEKAKLINYGVEAVNATDLWKKGFEGQGSIVAIIDTGCDLNHPELKQNIIGQFNFTGDDNGDSSNATDYIGHGTHVAGIIAASNFDTIIGIAPKAKLLILKIIDINGNSDYKKLIQAIHFARNWRGPNSEKVNVLNLSLGGRKNDLELKNAIDQSIEENIIIVVSAGNYGDGSEFTDETLYPGAYEEVIQVASVDIFNNPTSFSNTNNTIDFLAPGVDILSTYPNNQFSTMTGTSMSSPHVSGSIALLLSALKSKNIIPDYNQIYQYLVSHSLVLEGHSKNTQGHGILKL